MNNNIEGKVVVTGASSGLGEATARLLSAQGATVVLGARRVERLQSVANELIASGGKALAIKTDVTHGDEVKALVDSAVQKYGRIDVMINNAGRMPQSPLERLRIDEWDRTNRRKPQGCAVRHCCGAAAHAAAESRTSMSPPSPAIRSVPASRSTRRPNTLCELFPKGSAKK